MSSSIAASREWILEAVGMDRDEVCGCFHDCPMGLPNETMIIEWTVRRERWLQKWREERGGMLTYAVCDRPWSLTHDHHRTYTHFGEELFVDLVSLCQVDHVNVHEVFEKEFSWLRHRRECATNAIFAYVWADVRDQVALLNVEGEDL